MSIAYSAAPFINSVDQKKRTQKKSAKYNTDRVKTALRELHDSAESSDDEDTFPPNPISATMQRKPDVVEQFRPQPIKYSELETNYKTHPGLLSGGQFTPQMPPTTPANPSLSEGNISQKLNYIISLLEETKDERTQSAMEDVILYSFLGIFVIFIVDTFVRVGRYTR